MINRSILETHINQNSNGSGQMPWERGETRKGADNIFDKWIVANKLNANYCYIIVFFCSRISGAYTEINFENFTQWKALSRSQKAFLRFRRLPSTGCSLNIVFFSKNSWKFATSPSATLGYYLLYKKLPANRSECTLALRWELWRSLTAM